jgi:hypothetical protein
MNVWESGMGYRESAGPAVARARGEFAPCDRNAAATLSTPHDDTLLRFPIPDSRFPAGKP